MNQTDQMTNAHSSSEEASANVQVGQRRRRSRGSDSTFTRQPLRVLVR